jgi:threonine dehydrogenase-like Zn-dependent dehydrogenase
MRAICLTGSRLRFQPDRPDPEPAGREALVRVFLAGICSTDLELVKGYMGFEGVLGHEFVGVVERAEDPDWVGRRVVSTINLANPSGPGFAEYGEQHDPARTVLGILGHDGAMADRVKLPLRNLRCIPKAVPDRAAVFTEPLAAALRIAEQIPVRPSDPVAVVGPGRLGMLIGQTLSLGGAAVTMLGRSDASLELARRWGLQSQLVDEADDDSQRLVVESTGNAEGLRHALRIIKPLGTLVMKSTYAEAPAVDLTNIVVGELTVIGSRCGPFEPALRLLARGQVDVESLIDAEYPIERGLEAFEHAARPGVRKVLLSL